MDMFGIEKGEGNEWHSVSGPLQSAIKDVLSFPNTSKPTPESNQQTTYMYHPCIVAPRKTDRTFQKSISAGRKAAIDNTLTSIQTNDSVGARTERKKLGNAQHSPSVGTSLPLSAFFLNLIPS